MLKKWVAHLEFLMMSFAVSAVLTGALVGDTVLNDGSGEDGLDALAVVF